MVREALIRIGVFLAILAVGIGLVFLNIHLRAVEAKKTEPQMFELAESFDAKTYEYTNPVPYYSEYRKLYKDWLKCPKCYENDQMFFAAVNDKEWICERCEYIFSDEENKAINSKMHGLVIKETEERLREPVFYDPGNIRILQELRKQTKALEKLLKVMEKILKIMEGR